MDIEPDWETESEHSLEYSDYELDSNEDWSGAEYDDPYPYFDTDIDSYEQAVIESVSQSTRANWRPRAQLDEDVMSEFSGDEEYEFREEISGEDGGGNIDMADVDPHEEISGKEHHYLTVATRKLMKNLTRGRLNREHKLHIASTKDSSSEHYIHRLVVRGEDFPQEIEFSPAYSPHHQCADSLIVTPSPLGLRDDLFTINHSHIIRCGLFRNKLWEEQEERHEAILNDRYDDDINSRVLSPVTTDLLTCKASKFMEYVQYQFGEVPLDEIYILTSDTDLMCMDHRYGYLAYGSDDGFLTVICTDGTRHDGIFDDDIARGVHGVMLNSIQIVRWPRYTQVQGVSTDDGADNDDDDEDDAGNDGMPSAKGQFDHYVVMAGNEHGIFIAALPDHPVEVDHPPWPSDPDHGKHTYKYKPDNTWIRRGFPRVRQDAFDLQRYERVNDAKASPNGQWIAVVGDVACVWVIKVTHEPETEEQRVQREQGKASEEENEGGMELDEDYETEEEYETDEEYPMEADYTTEEEHSTDEEHVVSNGERPEPAFEGLSGNRLGSSISKKLSHGKSPAQSQPQLSSSSSSSLPPPRPGQTRMLHSFGTPERLDIPESLVYNKGTIPKPRLSTDTSYSSQYIAWNASSTMFAHTSDTVARVFVWSMPAKELVYCVDSGGPSFAIAFHPVLDSLFAFANWYGFVHVVDISGTCVGDFETSQEDVQMASTPSSSSSASTSVPASAAAAAAEKSSGAVKSTEKSKNVCQGPTYEEKHDIVMLSFRGEYQRRLRILDGIRGLRWSTDGRHLYVATVRRVLKYELKDERVRIPSLFQLCANKVRDWKEREIYQKFKAKGSSEKSFQKEFGPLIQDWKYVPLHIKRKIWGDMYMLRSHH
ncbi:hypothetical protein BGZ94_009766 [Podila epigama]|nr:hypothetical protein BGZ94_009766 [Podila epigama]